MEIVLLLMAGVAVVVVLAGVKIVPQAKVMVIERLGRFLPLPRASERVVRERASLFHLAH